MSFDPLENQSMSRAAYGSDVDVGLQSHMRRVYNLMSVGLGITGLTAYAVAASPALTNFFIGTREHPSAMLWVVLLAPLAFVFFGFSSQRLMTMSTGAATRMFFAFSAVMGLSTSTVFLAYTQDSIARVFFITAAAFAATSLYGYTTKRDLTGVGAFMYMGVVGLIIAGVVNLFVGSHAIDWVTSVLGVVIFTSLLAWKTQLIKESYRPGNDEANGAMAVRGALGLYISVLNLFMSLIDLMGNRR